MRTLRDLLPSGQAGQITRGELENAKQICSARSSLNSARRELGRGAP